MLLSEFLQTALATEEGARNDSFERKSEWKVLETKYNLKVGYVSSLGEIGEG